MTILLHTTTDTAVLGLADGARLLAKASFSVDRQFVTSLAERIRQFLTVHHALLPTLTKIVVHAGPGRWTGLRIGVATANALAYALHIPIVGVPGSVPILEDLLDRSCCAHPPAKDGLVIPVYRGPPHISSFLRSA